MFPTRLNPNNFLFYITSNFTAIHFLFYFNKTVFFICTVKVVTNTVHNSTYIHLLTIRHVTEFTFITCMQMLNDYIAYLQYTMLLTGKHHLYDINYLHYVTLDYTIFHYNTLHYLLTYIAYNTLHNLTIRCITYLLYVVIV